MTALAPKLSELGGGIAREQVGERTERYEQYFSEDASAQGATELTQKRLRDYQTVVNSCACARRGTRALRTPR